ncbi:MAG TPA: type II secretion system F family protein [Planctomycetota bacterium]|nr:type II secretion system F family protein [Planctomycetota bacterium]
MPKFKYVARDAAGNRITKTVDGTSKDEVLNNLKKENLQVLSVTEDGAGGGAPAKGGAAPAKGGFWNMSLGGVGNPKPKVSGEMLVVFTRQFATMISAGIPVLECLTILQEQAEDPGFARALQQIVDDVRGGSDLSQSLAKHPLCFERIYVNMIKAGEASGQLDTILGRLADYMESTEKLKREIKGAMTYPVVSLVMILGITIFLLVFIIPKFNDIFKTLRVDLPLPTVIVMGISKIMTDYFLQACIICVGLFLMFKWWKSTDSGAYTFDRMILKAPVFGDLIQKVALSRFSKTFATLLRSGVPILGALEIVASTAGNRVVEEAVNNARESIRQGENLAKPLSESVIFPPMVVRMIAIGEKSGALEQLLEKISEFYDQQVEATVESLTSLIEPLMIGVMGVIVGGIVLSVFLPIFKIQDALRKK